LPKRTPGNTGVRRPMPSGLYTFAAPTPSWRGTGKRGADVLDH